MAFGIMRVEKRHKPAVYGLQIEATRKPEDEASHDFANSDIDWSRTGENVTLVASNDWNRSINEECANWGVKPRKDSVVLLDGFYGASPEFMDGLTRDQQIDFFKQCLDYHRQHYGIVINAVIHFDETTPHMQVASVPLCYADGKPRLSADRIMGGRGDYIRRQDEIHEQVFSKWGLDRGAASAETKRKHKNALDHKIEQAKDAAVQIEQDARERGKAIYSEYEAAGRDSVAAAEKSAESYDAIARTMKAAAADAKKELQETQRATESARGELGQVNAQLTTKRQELSDLSTSLDTKQRAGALDRVLGEISADLKTNLVWIPAAQEIPERRGLGGKIKQPPQMLVDKADYTRLLQRVTNIQNVAMIAGKADDIRDAAKESAAALDVETQVQERTASQQCEITRQRAEIKRLKAEKSQLQQDKDAADRTAAAAAADQWNYELLCRALDYIDYGEDKRESLLASAAGRAAEMEALLHLVDDLQPGESVPGYAEYNTWTGGYSYKLSDGSSRDRSHLISEYLDLCESAGFQPDPDIQNAGRSIQRSHGRSR